MALKVYERYMAREIYGATALVLAAFLALYAFIDLSAELQNLGQGGYQFQHAVGYVLLTLPGRVYEVFPIAVLVGTLYALTLLAKHSEITVLRTSGLSTDELLVSLARIGAAFVVLTLLFGELIAPPAEKAAQQLRLQAMSSVVAQEFRSGLWVKDEMSFVNVREVLPDAALRGIRIYEFDDHYRLRAISEAEKGEFLPPDRWKLTKIVRTIFEGDQASIVREAEVEWRSALNPDILSVLLVVPERMSLVNLYLYIRHLEDNQQKSERYVIALWKKLIYPLAALVMMALAVPFSYMHSRSGAVSLKVFAGVMLGITFLVLNTLFSSLGVINSWPPFISAITPSALYLLGSAGLIWWVEKR